jgi:antitoxin CptB
VPDPERARSLRWRCRRGMKELDVLFERFVEAHFADLNAGHWPELEPLLECEDDTLWDWLQNPAVPDAAGFRELLERIRRGQ